MKIVVLMGSPRKKDSYHLCKQIEEQINRENHCFKFDYIFINDYKIKDCKGCCLCFQKSENDCPCGDDDLNNIKERLFAADGVIVASPVYAYQVTGQMKRFIDRMSYLFHRQVMVGKPALIVVTTDGGGSKQVYKYIKMTLAGWGLDIVGNIQIASPMYFETRLPKSALGYDKNYFERKSKKLNKISREFVQHLTAQEKQSPGFYDIFMFNCLRSKIYTSSVDRDYWEEKGWLNSNYFYEVKLNPIKWVLGVTIKKIIHRAGARYLKANDTTRQSY